MRSSAGLKTGRSVQRLRPLHPTSHAANRCHAAVLPSITRAGTVTITANATQRLSHRYRERFQKSRTAGASTKIANIPNIGGKFPAMTGSLVMAGKSSRGVSVRH